MITVNFTQQKGDVVLPTNVELLLRKKLTDEEYLVVMASIETLVNRYRKGQDSTNYFKMVASFRKAMAA